MLFAKALWVCTMATACIWSQGLSSYTGRKACKEDLRSTVHQRVLAIACREVNRPSLHASSETLLGSEEHKRVVTPYTRGQHQLGKCFSCRNGQGALTA